MVSILNLMAALVFLAGVTLAVIVLKLPRQPNRGSVTRTLCSLYQVAIGLILVVGIGTHIGFRDFGSPRLDPADQYSFQRVGFFSDQRFTFKGQPTGEGFFDPALAEDESIELIPTAHPTGTRVDQWNANILVHSRPLRVNGRCVNLSADAWLASADSIQLELWKEGELYQRATVRWERHRNWRLQRTERFKLSSWRRANDGWVDEVNDEVVSNRAYRDSRRLADMLRNPAPPLSFATGSLFLERWAPLCEQIVFVRETQGDTRSRMGVFVDEAAPISSPGRRFALWHSGVNLLEQGVQERTLRLASGDRIACGYGLQPPFQLAPLCSDLVMTDEGVPVYTVDLAIPTKWPLPPEPKQTFILTSAESYVPADGYVFPEAGTQHPFYVKARFNRSLDSLIINTGRSISSYGPGQEIMLGDVPHQGIRVRVQKRTLPLDLPIIAGTSLARHPGVLASVVVGFVSLAFVFVLLAPTFARDAERARLDLAWTVLFSFVLTILVLRLILAYRAGLLPPTDATPAELTNVFRGSFRVSFWGLVIVPSVMLLAHAFGDWSRLRNGLFANPHFTNWLELLRDGLGLGSSTRVNSLFGGHSIAASVTTRSHPLRLLWDFRILFWPVLVWVLGARLFGDGEQFFIRASHGTHLLLVASLILALPRLIRLRPAEHWVTFLAVVFALWLDMFLVGDFGFFIYGFSFAAFLLFLISWETDARDTRVDRAARWTAILGCLTGVVAFAMVLTIWSDPQTGSIRVISKAPEHVKYRLHSLTETQEDVLLARSGEVGLNMTELLRNAHQHWQMTLYDAEGRHRPRGYGRGPLTDRGMTYPTTLSDCVYSVFVLGENGAGFAFSLVVLYVGIGAVLVGCGPFLPRNQKARLLVFVLIGTYFAGNALYMAFANLGVVVFTGQNIPLLSLYSRSDLIQNGILLSIVSFGLSAGVWEEASQGPYQDLAAGERRMVKLRVALGVLGVGLLLLLYWALHRIDIETADRHNFPKVFAQIAGRPWTYNEKTGRMETASRSPLTEIEAYYKDQFDQRDNKIDERAGLYYLDEVRDERGRVLQRTMRTNSSYFVLKSPFHTTPMWTGDLLARDDDHSPALATLGEEFRIRLHESKQPQYVVFGERPTIDGARSVLVTARDHQRIIRLERTEAGSVRLYPFGGWKIHYEGRVLEADTTLKPLDLIVLESPKAETQTILYLGVRPPLLATTQWRNGVERHVYPDRGKFGVAHTLMRASDWMAAEAGREDAGLPSLPDSVLLTIDLPLHGSLQENLNEFAARSAPYGPMDPLHSNIIALTVLDSYTGEVLAMPSWPYSNPNEQDFDRRVGRMSAGQQRRMLANYNFRRHVIGSTIKPLVFSAVASGLQPKRDLAEMTVYSRATADPETDECAQELVKQHRKFKRLHSHVGGIRLSPCWDSDWDGGVAISSDSFLVQSLNYYEVITGLAGMILEPSEIESLLVPARLDHADVSFGNEAFTLDFSRLPILHWRPGKEQDAPPIVNDRVSSTLLFRGLRDLFPAIVPERGLTSPTHQRTKVFETAKRFLPYLAPTQEYTNEYLDECIPDPVILDPTGDWREGSLRAEVVPFLLGGGISLWNNVDMATAAARLATGLDVVPTLQVPPSGREFEKLPWPVGDAGWRNEHLITPMMKTGTEGTARVIRAKLGDLPEGYRVLFKTGTLPEVVTVGKNDPRSELLMFTVGKWENEAFLPGKTVSGYLYMQNSRMPDEPYKRNILAPILLRTIVDYLAETRNDLDRGYSRR